MNELKTVKEVCAITGLNRKLLFVYDKEGIVKPSAYQNQHKYKLYDDEAIRRLQQIAIYEKLGVNRSEIKARFISKGKSAIDLLDEQIHMLQRRKQEIEDLLIVAEQLKVLGIKGELTQSFANINFSEIAHNTVQWNESLGKEILDKKLEELEETKSGFENEMEAVISSLFSLNDEERELEKEMEIVKQLLKTIQSHFGFSGWLVAVVIAYCVENEGEIYSDMIAEIGQGPTENSAKAICAYFKSDMDLMWEEYAQIVAKYRDVIGKDYVSPKVELLIGELKELLNAHTGLQSRDDYEIFFDIMRISKCMEGEGTLSFILKAMEYYHKNT